MLVLLSGEIATYIGIGSAVEAISWLNEHGYHVVGFEGFTCDGSVVRSAEGYVADLTALGASRDEVVDAAKNILEQWIQRVEWIDIELLESNVS